MPVLTIGQFSLVVNVLSFTFAAMLASFIFFVLARGQVLPKYRPALIMSALVVAIAGYHYFRILESWQGAFALVDGAYQPTGKPFNDAYRYVDWLLTVPLLTAELVAVLSLPRDRSVSLTWRLAGAAALMIILGYPGEIAGTVTERAIWGFLSTIPFVYILFVLFRELGPAIERQPPQAQVLVRNIRLLLFATWGFYPIVYLLPIVGVSLLSPEAVLSVQVGYSIADVAAKCGYGLVIYAIARAKTEAEGGLVPSDAEAKPAIAAGS
jgi:bacteriorhodopsin